MTPTAPTPAMNSPHPRLPDDFALHALADGRLPPEHAERLRASPQLTTWLNRVAGTLLVGFGLKLALSK